MFRKMGSWCVVLLAVLGALSSVAFASTSMESHDDLTHSAQGSGWLLVIYAIAVLGGVVRKKGHVAALGQLLLGIVAGNLTLLGVNWFTGVNTDPYIQGLSHLGVYMILFMAGAETNFKAMLQTGGAAVRVASTGVILPVLAGFGFFAVFMPNESFEAQLFAAAAMAATSVGLTVTIFKNMGRNKSPEYNVVKGAAIQDDVMGLTILAVVMGLVMGNGNLLAIGAEKLLVAVAYFVGAFVIGQILPHISRVSAWCDSSSNGKFAFVLLVIYANVYGVELLGLEGLLGAFGAGLMLDDVHVRLFEKENGAHTVVHGEIEDVMRGFEKGLAPIFFVTVGMSVSLQPIIDNPSLVPLGIALGILAALTKYVAGFTAGGGINPHIVGWAMVPRAEVGLIFVASGKSIGVLSPELVAVVIIMVVFTTFVAPFGLNYWFRREDAREAAQAAATAAEGAPKSADVALV